MTLLGIDYGRVHLGLALSETGISSPLKVVSTKSDDRKIEIIKEEIVKNNIQGLVIGKGSGQIENHIRGFIARLTQETGLPVFAVDETLTSNEAVSYMIQDNVPVKKKRRDGTCLCCLYIIKFIL